MLRRNTCCWKKPGVVSPQPIWPTNWQRLVSNSLTLSSEQMQPPVVGEEDIGGIALLAERHEVVPPWILRLQIVGPLLMIVVGQELAPVQAERNVVRAKRP